MKPLLVIAFIGLVLAMWSRPLAGLARSITAVNETHFSIVMQIKYRACRGDVVTLAAGKAWRVNAGGCLVSSVDVRVTDSKGATINACNSVFPSPTLTSRFAVTPHGYGGCAINSAL